MSQDWKEHIKNLKGVKPRELLVQSVPFVKEKGEALDLGAGALGDSIYMLDQGFGHVTAVDLEDYAKDIAGQLPQEKFSYVTSSFQDFDFEHEKYDLVNAQYSLPFNPSESLEKVISGIKTSLKPGGVFSGNFFGLRDSWSEKGRKDVVFLERSEVETLFSDMEIIRLEEQEHDARTSDGKPKHWHLFNVIARK